MLLKSAAKSWRVGPLRSFHASAIANRVVATNPVKAEAVTVCMLRDTIEKTTESSIELGFGQVSAY